MSRIFTKRSLIGLAGALMLLISLSVSSYADEYKSMIRYDRVWECLNLEGMYKNMYIKCMKFDGTEEIQGKTYHRLVTFKKSTYTGDKYITDDIVEYEGFLREENGIVYTLIDDNEGPYVPSSGVAARNTDKLTEIALYDFNHKVSDEYQAGTFITGGAHECQFKVLSQNSIEIDGEICRCFEVSGIDTDGLLMPPHMFIEGIGAGENGCLNYHEYCGQPLTKMWLKNSLNRVFDIDGNIIFKNLDGSQFDDLQYDSFISEVDAINTPKAENDAMYDILGRRISSPAPGQLYIHGGKKHIAK